MAGRDLVALSPGQDEAPDKYYASWGLQDQARSFQNLAVESWKAPAAEAWLPKKGPSKGAGDKPLVR